MNRWRQGCLGSAAAEGVDDLDHVTLHQWMTCVQAARDDVAVDLDRYATLQQLFGLQQIMQSCAVGQGAGFTVELDVHDVIVPDVMCDDTLDLTAIAQACPRTGLKRQ